jgi:hypothetical protein
MQMSERWIDCRQQHHPKQHAPDSPATAIHRDPADHRRGNCF